MRPSKSIKIGIGDYAAYVVGRCAPAHAASQAKAVLDDRDCAMLNLQREETRAFLDHHDALAQSPMRNEVLRHAEFRNLPFCDVKDLDIYQELSIALQAADELPAKDAVAPHSSRLWAEAHVALLEVGEALGQVLQEAVFEQAFYAAYRSLSRRGHSGMPAIGMVDCKFVRQTDLARRSLNGSRSPYFTAPFKL